MADTAIAIQGNAVPAPVGMSDPEVFAAMIERVAVNPQADVEKIERLYELHERMRARASETAYYAAMNTLQAELPVIEHTKKISYQKGNETIVKGTYTPWEDIDAAIRPIYIKHGFSISFEIDQPVGENVGPAVSCIVMHRDGHKVQYKPMRLPPDVSGSKNAAQAIGSAVSYAKRYSACLALNITTSGAEGSDDDDGNNAAPSMTPHEAHKHQLWETLTQELRNECADAREARDWYERTKQYRKEWRAMPAFWQRLFFDEVFVPYVSRLKGPPA